MSFNTHIYLSFYAPQLCNNTSKIKKNISVINRYNIYYMENKVSDIEHNNIIDNVRSIDKNGTLLDILLEFEKVLDDTGMYAYKNWKVGEVAEGPKLSRYWLHVKLMYPCKMMPDPKAGLRLTKLGCEVKFEKGVLKEPVMPKSSKDLDPDGKPKLKSHDVWLVDVLMPRKFVDEFTDEQVKMGDSQVDMEALNNAYDKGLDDETNQAQDI